MNRQKLEKMIENYENGNKQAFRDELKDLNPGEVATLIAMWQPYHTAIATIQNSWETIEAQA